MVKVLVGNLFESKAQTLVNTVNCVGVMGKGIALEFKKRFPDMFRDYKARCDRGEVKLGQPYLYRPLVPPWILNFPTKDDWRSVTKLADIEQGLEYILRRHKEWGITSLAVPPLGCGLGQLEWRVVGPTLYRHLQRMEIPVELYAPYGTPHEEMQVSFLDQTRPAQTVLTERAEPERIRPEWIGLVEILRRLQSEPYHWPVGRTTFQKIAYVATAEGLQTGLNYRRGSFGPFSPEIKAVISRLQNHGLLEEQRLGPMFNVRVGRTFSDAWRAYAEMLRVYEPVLAKTADLFMRLDTHQAELVATVLFAAHSLQRAESARPTECEVLDEVMRWKQKRRPPLDERDVASTVRNLAALGWLNVRASSDLPVSDADLVGA